MKNLLRNTFLAGILVMSTNAAGPIYVIRTTAMEPTLLKGDRVLAPGGERVNDLRRGDVIVFHFPLDPSVVLVKRLIGLPGDHIRLSHGTLLLNSKPESEPYVQHSAGANASPFLSDFPQFPDQAPALSPDARKMLERFATSGELAVPHDSYFVLGDNRDYSDDSRSWGFVEASQIIGRVHEIVSSENEATRTPRTERVHLKIERGALK